MSGGATERGHLITIEGIDGAGKSTQVEFLATALAAHGHRVVATREPGGTPLGRELRRLLLVSELSLSADAELLLFLADRAEHLATVVRPALAAGTLVLCDRYSDSTIAYQGYGRQGDLARVRHWDAESRGGLEADLTLLLDCPVAVAAARRRRDPDRYQALDLAFHERVREGFLALAVASPERVHRIDASTDLAGVSRAVLQAALEWLDLHGGA